MTKMKGQATMLENQMWQQSEQRSHDEIVSLADALTVHLTDLEDKIDDSMYHAALVLQKMDTFSDITLSEMKDIADEVRVNDLYLADMNGIFTVSTVPEAPGTSLFEIWDGYRMLVTGEAMELPSAIKVMAETGKIYKFTALPRYDAKGKIKGALESALDVSTIEDDLAKMTEGYSMITGLQLFEPTGVILISTEKASVKEHFTKGETASLPEISETINAGTLLKTGDDGTITFYKAIDRLGGLAYVMRIELESSYYNEGTNGAVTATENLSKEANARLLLVMVISMVIQLLVSFCYIVLVNRGVLQPIAVLRGLTRRVSQGDISLVEVSQIQNEIGELERDFAEMVGAIHKQAELMDKVAGGDYTETAPVRSEKDIMNEAINRMLSSSSNMISEIKESATHVEYASGQIAQVSQNMAQGASEQATTIAECTDTITKIQDMANENTKTAASAMEQVQDSGNIMSQCTEAMNQMLGAMHSIDEQSKDIAKVIVVIDDIAFQSNILALNAAIEAARAGEAGKGFAVVADEVRNLASKSAEAAKEIASLIEGSSQSVAEGNAIVEKVSESLCSVREVSEQNATSIAGLRDSSTRQSESMEHVVVAIAQLSSSVQTNIATAEETAAASEEMSSESTTLNQIVGRFQLMDNGRC
ncbi:methyl-accepting chemotaxis protein [Lachnospiraceae bacterium ZAX-1]